MNCDNCGKEITSREACHINSSREYWLLKDNGGQIDTGIRENIVCWECQSLAIKLLVKENLALEGKY